MSNEKRFNPDEPAYAVTDLQYAGVVYFAGETFPAPSAEKVSERELFTMWNGERILFGPPPRHLVEDAARRRKELAEAAKKKTPAKGTATAATAQAGS